MLKVAKGWKHLKQMFLPPAKIRCLARVPNRVLHQMLAMGAGKGGPHDFFFHYKNRPEAAAMAFQDDGHLRFSMTTKERAIQKHEPMAARYLAGRLSGKRRAAVVRRAAARADKYKFKAAGDVRALARAIMPELKRLAQRYC